MCFNSLQVIKLEAANAALTEASQLDRVRLQEQATRIAQLEAEQRTLHDRMSSLQASEACAQRASVRLQVSISKHQFSIVYFQTTWSLDLQLKIFFVTLYFLLI